MFFSPDQRQHFSTVPFLKCVSHYLFHCSATCLHLEKKLPITYKITLKPGILCSNLTTARSSELCESTRQTEKERRSLEACSVGPLTWIQSKQALRSFLLKAATRNYRQQKRDNADATGHFHAATQFCWCLVLGTVVKKKHIKINGAVRT